MVEEIAERFGRLDLLVNNAGVAPRERKDILEAGEESYDRVMRINLRGPYFLTQLAARRMVEWKQAGVVPSPRIVFITSVSAYTSSPSRGEYCISKAGLSMAVKLYADRLAEFAIPVIEIRPGIIETPMTSVVKEKYDKMIADGLLPTKRWGRPEDVAKVVSAVARGDLDYSTGQVDRGGGRVRPAAAVGRRPLTAEHAEDRREAEEGKEREFRGGRWNGTTARRNLAVCALHPCPRL